jgi:ribonuclease P protein component
MHASTDMDQRLRPFERMQLPRDFRRVFQKGRRFGTAFLRIHFVPNHRPYSRLGLVVRRKLGKAATRNRLKRRLREVFRKHKYELDTPLDIVLVAERESMWRDNRPRAGAPGEPAPAVLRGRSPPACGSPRGAGSDAGARPV